MEKAPADRERDGPAFLLAQLGAHAASKFAARMRAIDLTPPLVGVLRFLARNPGSIQKELADAIGMPASRLVAMADQLESRGLVCRVRDEEDRRSHRITLTAGGEAELAIIAREAREHKNELLAALSTEEQDQLAGLLQRVAIQQGLRLGVHPGLSRPSYVEQTEPL
ncbi:MarR family winged helix-turn-helix transcriptional regulator [Mesorhizobium shangrilense]|uniref:MarR family transcriptional regulator n=1 Tax=Mesorhizobium shangrilense TaxID=460060 RepID=A0ABV2DLU1_9HYPH